MNTPSKGDFRYIVFRDGKEYYAVALEFNIVESGSDPTIAFFNLLQAVDGYISASKKVKGFRYSFLNQEANSEYEMIWKSLKSKGGKIKSPYQVALWGCKSLA